MQQGRNLALFGREIDVARGEREPVCLAHDRRADNLHRNIEIAHQLLDDQKLLVVLLAEHGDVGSALHEELGDDRGDAVEMIGPRRAAQALRQIADLDKGLEAFRIHLGGFRRENEIDAGVAELLEIAGFVARVGRRNPRAARTGSG